MEVRKVSEVTVLDMASGDVVEVRFGGHHLSTEPTSLVFKKSETQKLNFPRGKMKVFRIKGDSVITVMAKCERT